MRFIYEAIFVLFLVSAIPAQNCEQTTALSQNKDGHNDHCPVHFPPCTYELRPLSAVFGAEVIGVDLATLDQSCADALRQEAIMYRFLLFREQDLSWQNQIKFTGQLGTPFMETSSLQRPTHPKTPDPRVGYFSNDPVEGVPGQGTEGWHIDGNSVPAPHQFTLICCVSASSNGPTLIVPLKEIVDLLAPEEREYLETIYYVSGFNASIYSPLIYKHPHRNENTIMLALGILSGLYKQQEKDGELTSLSKDQTQFIQDLLEAKILGSNLIYAHQYNSKDVLLLNNPAVAHLAGPGSQGSVEVYGLRLMHRSTVRGERPPSKTSTLNKDAATKRCKNVNKHADLATLPNREWNDLVKKIIARIGVPHWLNGTNPSGYEVFWGDAKSEFTNWNLEQPNDHDGPEVCVVIGPFGEWFDLACEPKTKEGSDPGPVITWEDGVRRKYSVYPLCGVRQTYL